MWCLQNRALLQISLFFIALFAATSALVITGPPEIAGLYLPTPADCIHRFDYVDGWVLDPETLPEATLQNLTARFDGAMVFMSTTRINSDDNGVPRIIQWDPFRFLDNGAAAIGIINTASTVSGYGVRIAQSAMTYDQFCDRLASRVVVDINYKDGNRLMELVKQYGNVTVRVFSSDPNPWYDIRRAWEKPWRIIFSICTGLISAFGLAKLIAYVRCNGIQLSIPQVTLSMLVIVTMFRTIYHAIDPVFFMSTFTVLRSLATLTISFPFELLSMLLISLYWQEILKNSKVKVKTFLGRSRWIFLAVAILTFIFELMQSILRTYVESIRLLLIVNLICYVVFGLVLTGLYVFNGFRLIIHIRDSDAKVMTNDSARVRSQRRLKRTAILIGAAAVFNIGWFISLLMAAAGVTETPQGFYGTFLLGWICLTAVSLVQILAFKTPKANTSSGSVSSSTPTPSSPR